MDDTSNYPVVRKLIDAHGVTYKPQGWFGCQLSSTEWKKPDIGEARTFCAGGRKFTLIIWRVYRRWFRYECLWCLENLGGMDVDDANARIRAFYEALSI